MMKKLLAAIVLAAIAGVAQAASGPALATNPIALNDALGQFWGLAVTTDVGGGVDINVVCVSGCSGGGGGGSVIANPPITTYQGTLTLAAATSTAINTLTLSNSTTYPASAQGVVSILNSGAALGYICFFGGTCSATGGSFPLVAGASVTKNLGTSTTVPTAFSTSGTTLAITN